MKQYLKIDPAWSSGWLNENPAYQWINYYFAQDLQGETKWPSIAQYNMWRSKVYPKKVWPITEFGDAYQFVEEVIHPHGLENSYDAMIHLQGRISTRCNNWHDFFNTLTWCMFPQLKKKINEMQYNQQVLRSTSPTFCKQRTPLENKLTQFDECGIIVLSTSDHLLKLLKNHEWESLFWYHRTELLQKMRWIVFGHATLDLMRNPYIGLTAKGIMLNVNNLDLNYQTIEQLSISALMNTQKLSPVPILGIPGWYSKCQEQTFYHDRKYFRPLRKSTI